MPPCRVPNCPRTVREQYRGLCHGHYTDPDMREKYAAPMTRPRRAVGDKWLDPDGYVLVCTAPGKCRHEHRIVMEDILGRPLVKGESVHHLNGFREDNRRENLELWVTPQRFGQRLDDLLAYAVKYHREELIRLLHEPV